MSTPSIGKTVPNKKLTLTGNQQKKLSDYRGRNLVLYFYPKDNTPGCTREGQDFRDRYAEFQALDTDIIGVSRDSLKTHQNFIDKHDFPFELASDPDEELCKAFDVIKEKNMYGRKVMGIERSTFIIDSAGKLRDEFRKVRVKGHVDAVLDAIGDMAGG